MTSFSLNMKELIKAFDFKAIFKWKVEGQKASIGPSDPMANKVKV